MLYAKAVKLVGATGKEGAVGRTSMENLPRSKEIERDSVLTTDEAIEYLKISNPHSLSICLLGE